MKTLQKCFLLAVAALLVVGLVRTLCFPKEINDYENRYASQFPAASTSAFLDGTFQDEAESSLSDQIPFSQYMKKAYNNTKTSFLLHAIHGVRALTGGDQGRYASFNGLCLYGDDFITNWPRTLSDNQADLDRKSAELNQTFANHPELTFWVYYVEKDTDVDFFTQEKAGFSEYLMQHLDLPDSQKATYTVDHFDEFSRQFFRTDTHWNLYGSYAGYRQLFDVLHCAGTPLEPTGDPVLVGEFSGVKARRVGADDVLTEPFYAYSYAFPDMTVTIDGQPVGDYGDQANFLAGTSEKNLSYGGFYGGDEGEVIFSTGTTDRGSLLVIGDSFDNAILKLLASHYDTLYSVDLRYYAHSMGRPFDLTAYTQAHGITNVLLLGNIDYFSQDTFDPEG